MDAEIGRDKETSQAVGNNLATRIVDSLSDAVLRRVLNTDPNFERLRYLAILAASTEPLFETAGTLVEGRITFNLRQLWRIATQLGLDFERFRGAERVFRMLEQSGYVRIMRDQRTDFHSQYYPTELGISHTALTLDRMKKIQEFDSQAKTTQTISMKQPASTPAVYEINLTQKPFTIGSGEQNDLSVDDRYMSSKHARVTYDSGRWIFEDLNSGNGSWKMEPNNLRRVGRAELAPNDLYQLGSTVVIFRQSLAAPTR